MTESVPRSVSRKVNGYVRTVLALERVRSQREAQYERFIRPLDRKRDSLAAEVASRLRALTGGQYAEAQRLLARVASPSMSDSARHRTMAAAGPPTSRASGSRRPTTV